MRNRVRLEVTESSSLLSSSGYRLLKLLFTVKMDAEQIEKVELLRSSFAENAVKLATSYRNQAVLTEIIQKEKSEKEKLADENRRLKEAAKASANAEERWRQMLIQMKQNEEINTKNMKKQLDDAQDEIKMLKEKIVKNENEYEKQISMMKRKVSLVDGLKKDGEFIKEQFSLVKEMMKENSGTAENHAKAFKKAIIAFKELRNQMNKVGSDNDSLRKQLESLQKTSAKLQLPYSSEGGTNPNGETESKLKAKIAELERELKLVSEHFTMHDSVG